MTLRAVTLCVGLLAVGAVGCQGEPPRPANHGRSVPARPAPRATATPGVADVVRRETVTFRGTELPRPLVGWLAEQRVVLLGEVHGIAEHAALVVALAKALHRTGTRDVLLEGAQAESWLTNAYVLGEADTLPPLAERYMRPILTGVRALNDSVPPDERIHVTQVDINHRDWAFPSSLALMDERHHQPAVSRFLASLGSGWKSFATPEDFTTWRKHNEKEYRDALSDLERALRNMPPTTERVRLVEMTEVARRSLEIRDVWEAQGEDAAHPAREEVIKSLFERVLERRRGPVLANLGGFHLQLKHVMGTPKVWLAEYLRTQSPKARGSVAGVYVAVARQYEADKVAFDISQPAHPGELFTLMNERAGGANAFLSLRDPVFKSSTLQVNYGGHVVAHAPGNQFDAFVLLGAGHKL